MLAGTALSLDAARPLRDDISTDEISPLPAMVHFDSTLGRFPYTGFKAGGEFPIGKDAIRTVGFEVVVAGSRYGKGSSREHSVVAERAAGVRLVLATSFERRERESERGAPVPPPAARKPTAMPSARRCSSVDIAACNAANVSLHLL